MTPALAASREGMAAAETRIEGIAGRLAGISVPGNTGLQAATDRVELSGEIVALLENRIAFQANAAAFRTAGELESQLMDLLG